MRTRSELHDAACSLQAWEPPSPARRIKRSRRRVNSPARA